MRKRSWWSGSIRQKGKRRMVTKSTRTTLTGEQRRAQIISVAVAIANSHGLQNVSQRTVGAKCEDITYHGVKYHFPRKRDLHKAVRESGRMTEQAVKDAQILGLIS